MSVQELNDEALQLLYQRKYYLLKKRCVDIEQANEKLLNRLYNVKKILKRYKKERSQLLNYLDKVRDNYEQALLPVFWDERNGLSEEDSDSDAEEKGAAQDVDDQSPTKRRGSRRRKTKEREAYMLFCGMQKASMKERFMEEKGEEPSKKELLDALLEEWGAISEEQRQTFFDMAEKKKQQKRKKEEPAVESVSEQPDSYPTPSPTAAPVQFETDTNVNDDSETHPPGFHSSYVSFLAKDV